MKRLIWFSVFLAVLVSVVPATPALAYPQPPQYYYHSLIQNVGSALCLQPEYKAAINGLTIVQQPCDYGPYGTDLYQRWWFDTVRLDYGQPGIYLIHNSGSGQCLDDRDGRTADGSPVQRWPCNDDSTTMQWKVIYLGFGGFQFTNMRTGKCLDVRAGSSAPGAVLQIYHCTSIPGTVNINIAQSFGWIFTRSRNY